MADAFTPLILANDQIRLQFIRYGARLVNLEVRTEDGRWRSVVHRLQPLAAYADDTASVGAIVGPFANRIALGRCVIDGQPVQLSCNHGRHHLHGAEAGFAHREWQASLDSPQALTFQVSNPAGLGGYPGNLSVTCRVSLCREPDRGVMFAYRAETDAPTIVNLTHHGYFNLAGEADFANAVADHELWLSAGSMLEVDEDLIPTGRRCDVSGTAFDFRTPRTLASALAVMHNDTQMQFGQGLDHCFINAPEGPAARVSCAGLQMTVTTDQPGLQVYTANHLDPSRSAVCLETQQFPDAPNHPGFPSAEVLPGAPFTGYTCYLFDWLDDNHE